MPATTIFGGRVRGNDQQTGHLSSYLSPDERVPANHPLRAIREMTEVALADLSARFELLYARVGRPSVPPPDDPGNPTVNFHGERRSNATHRSTTDPDSRLLRKANGHEAKLQYVGGLLIENRHGLVVHATAVVGSGTAEREVAIAQVTALPSGPKTLGGDKGFVQRAFVEAVRATGGTPHVAAKTKYSAIDGRTTRHPGYAVSQRIRKRIEAVFGWMKSVGLLRKLRHRGVARVNWTFIFTAAACNLVRMRNLAARPA
jgi:Transposase DDE domain